MLSKLKKKLSKSKHTDNYNHLNKDTSRIALSNYDYLLYRLYYVEPTNEFKLVIFKQKLYMEFLEIGSTKYYDTHVLIGQYVQFRGKLYTEYEYRLLLYKASLIREKKEKRREILKKLKKKLYIK